MEAKIWARIIACKTKAVEWNLNVRTRAQIDREDVAVTARD